MVRIHAFAGEKMPEEWGSVRVNGIEAPLAPARVSAVPYNIEWPGHQRSTEDTEIAPFVSFESDGPAEIRVCSERIQAGADLIVRPQSKGVRVSATGNEATFVLPEPGAYTFEVNGFREALHLFFDPIRDFAAEEEKTGRKILRYVPGVHEIGNVEIKSHTAVVLDAGAVVYGSFTAIGGEDICICGYGIIDASREVRTSDTRAIPYSYRISDHKLDLTVEANLRLELREDRVLNGCLRFYNCRNFSVEGVILRDAPTFALIPANCEDFVIDRVKTIGMWRFNSDGIDLFNSRNAVIRNCFLRNFDDCIVIKGIRGWDTKNNENILVEKCVVWCDWGSALEVGAETNAERYENILFRDCDVIHGTNVMMRIQHCNRAGIRNVVFENIRAEYSKYGLPRMYIEEGKPYCGKPNEYQPRLFVLIITPVIRYSDLQISGTMEDIRIGNITVYKDGEVAMPIGRILGKDEEHRIRNVSVGKIYVNGKAIRDPEKYIEINSFCDRITIGDAD